MFVQWRRFLKSLSQHWFSLRRRYFLLGILSLLIAVGVIPGQVIASAPAPYPLVVSTPTVSSPLEEGRKLYAAGQFADAITAWQAAVQSYAANGDRLNQALSLSYLSLAYQELNQWQDATDAIEQSLAVLETLNSEGKGIILAQALNTKAGLLLHIGQTDTALETWERSATLYQQAGDQLGSLGAQINQAQAMQSLGFYRRSREHLEKIMQQLAAMPDSGVKLAGLRNLGMTLRLIGDLSASQTALEESLAIAKRLNATTEISTSLLALGEAIVDQGDLTTGIGYFQQAERMAVNPTDQLHARLNQLKLYTEHTNLIEPAQWHPVQALAYEIYQQLSTLPSSRTSTYGAVNLAAGLSKLEDVQQPIPAEQLARLLANAVQASKTLKDPQAEAYALLEWGKLYIQSQQWAEATKLTQESLAIARQIQADDIASQSAWQLGKILKQQGKGKEAIAAYDEAIKSLKALRGDLVAINSNIQFSFRESVEPVYREMVALLLDDNPDQTSLARARGLIESLQLAELDNFFREACLDTNPQQIDQIDSTATVVYPILLSDRLATIVSTPGQSLKYYTTPIPQVEVETTLRAFLASLHPSANSQDRSRLSQQVYDWLVRPAETAQLLTQTKTLVFVPDGLLRSVPMAALHDGEKYLIEKYAVSLSPGLQLMVAQPFAPDQIKALVGGISDARNGFSALPEVESEVQKISQLISASTLLNQQFTSEAIAQKIQNGSANIVHLATHGQFSSKREDTFLLSWEGRINVNELSELLRDRQVKQSKALDLLVLSACDTASGDDRAVLGLAGLAVRSGARSTIATLWPVKDKAASLLMTEFYEQLKQPGVTKAQALQRAQVSLLSKTDFKEPFFWSAFVLVGSWM
ncbi:MAG: CHAT domain-containing protein [Oscillatoriophycideae cyanobacterium NC_groundwater_1537_Pr4_S-0.65um_50_18]|nr:CHAT domain-containing protein [Oscillatoriophycideae cyanobacterium NC_groundwater_1537_Pr4_S-0.65um_50_18]